MSPRRRSEKRRSFPANLYETGGYYSWKHPETGEHMGIGRDRREAFKQAMEANASLAIKRPTLLERITGASNTWGDWCNEFEKKLAERTSAATTKRSRKSMMSRLRLSFDESRAALSISTRDCAEVLQAIKNEGKHRMAQAFRSFMVDCFDRMIAAGWRSDNPVKVTDKVEVKVQRARLTLEAFLALYKATQIVWLRNAMALALVAGKDRDSVRNAKFTDFRDGGWWNERGKTGARVFLPLNLRLNVFGMSLDDVVKQCRSTGIVSAYLIHQTQRAKGATLGQPLHIDTITRSFSLELAKLKLNFGGKEPPTFHEIRSLAARLHKEQGDVDPQDLLSHKDPKSTATYTDGRGEWVRLVVKN
jgi:enterobacteria phage integrase